MKQIYELPFREKQVWIQAFGKGDSLPVIHCLVGNELHDQLPALEALIAPALEQKLCRPFVLTGYSPINWNQDYTPWSAPALSPTAEAFTGGGAATLEWLRSSWLPDVQCRIPADITERYLLGYSLGGLCALWMLYQCDIFLGCACCSGSLWYDGWSSFLQSHRIPKPGSRVYLSLGKNEEKARNPRMAAVGDATRKTHAQLQNDNNVAETMLKWHEGGHFTDIQGRLATAILWLMTPHEKDTNRRNLHGISQN